MHSNVEAARREAQRQADAGLIQGGVVASTRTNEIIVVGRQCVKPAARPMTEHSRFDIASVGKVFTTACLARLIIEGQVDPDAPFTRYIPEHILGEACDITVRDLAMHVGGFDNSKPYASADVAVFDRELFNKRPIRPRLEAFEYACSNFILLGKIVNRLSGLDLDTFARRHLWGPLGMTETTWNAPGEGPHEVEHWIPNRPAGQHNDDVCFLAPFPLGSGSCFSTIRDMLRFAGDLLERRTFPQTYYDLIFTCGFEKQGDRRSFGWDMTDAKRPQGLSRRTIFHSGWTGQTLCVDPENDFAAVVLTSRTTDDWQAGFDGRNRVIEALLGR
jgi:CubicO group peptidase (beta-lactamase class C family)